MNGRGGLYLIFYYVFDWFFGTSKIYEYIKFFRGAPKDIKENIKLYICKYNVIFIFKNFTIWYCLFLFFG